MFQMDKHRMGGRLNQSQEIIYSHCESINIGDKGSNE